MTRNELEKILKKNKWYDFGNGEFVKHQLKIKLLDIAIIVQDLNNTLLSINICYDRLGLLAKNKLKVNGGGMVIYIDLDECKIMGV